MLLKRLLQNLFDAFAIRIARAHINLETHPKQRLRRICVDEAVDYIREKGPKAILLDTQFQLLAFAMDNVSVDGMYLEFGVKYGRSINFLAGKTNKTIHGFDSFFGLPSHAEGSIWVKGTGTQQGVLPKVASNVRLVVGLFDDTLPAFAQQARENVAFVHIDCDLYDSTKSVLNVLAGRIVPGTIIVFDEYLNFPGWREHESKAFGEFVAAHKVKYRYIGFARHQAAIRIESTSHPSGTKGLA